MPLITMTYQPRGRAFTLLEGAGDVWAWRETTPIPRHLLLEKASRSVALFTVLTDQIDTELLDVAPHLRVVSNMAVGVDNIDLTSCTARGIPVGHTPDVLTETTADTAFGLLLMAARRLAEGVDYVRAGSWLAWDPELLLGRDVNETVLGIVGFGRIGQAIARRASGFNMEVVYTARSRNEKAEHSSGARYLTFRDLLGFADHVVVATPLTEETYHLMDADAFALMKRSATLVNISRGGTVDPDALFEALRVGTIAAAGLDVTEPEPIADDSPLLTLENCVIIPHLGSSSRRTREAMALLAVRNILAGIADEPLPACANPAVYA